MIEGCFRFFQALYFRGQLRAQDACECSLLRLLYANGICRRDVTAQCRGQKQKRRNQSKRLPATLPSARTARSVSPALQKTHGTMHLCFRILMIKTNRGRGESRGCAGKGGSKEVLPPFWPRTYVRSALTLVARSCSRLFFWPRLLCLLTSGSGHGIGVASVEQARRVAAIARAACFAQCSAAGEWWLAGDAWRGVVVWCGRRVRPMEWSKGCMIRENIWSGGGGFLCGGVGREAGSCPHPAARCCCSSRSSLCSRLLCCTTSFLHLFI